MKWAVLLLLFWCATAPGQDVYQGWTGRWVIVDTTAYTPHDPEDRDHWSTQDQITANGRDWEQFPYGIAVPMKAGASGRREVPLLVALGTKVIIPVGYGYLDRIRPKPEDRLFLADDTGGRISTLSANAAERGQALTIDLRFRDIDTARKWGRRRIQVFICDAPSVEAPPPPPSDPVPTKILEFEDWERLMDDKKAEIKRRQQNLIDLQEGDKSQRREDAPRQRAVFGIALCVLMFAFMFVVFRK